MISTRGRYAIRIMADLAQQDSSSYIPLRDIAARQEISKKYLEVIVRDLVQARLVAGTSGKGGGYRLTRKPEEYTIGEILEVTEGTLHCVACLADPEYKCQRKENCLTLPMWKEFDSVVHDFFYGRKLSDLTGTDHI